MILYTIPIISQLETVMKHVLNFFHANLHLPWAWAIVGTTVVVRMLLVPLTIKQIHSMQNLQRYAPQMKEIQKKYKHDKQKQNEELMKFYRENSINPAASCLPMLLQLPVFIALYYTLKHFNENFPEAAHQNLSWLHFVPNITAHTTSFWGGYVLLVVYVGRLTVMNPKTNVIRIAALASGLVVVPGFYLLVGRSLLDRRTVRATAGPGDPS